MLYRVLRAINRAYGLVAFGMYLFAFIVAFVMVFAFPPGTIVLLLLSVLSVGFVVLGAYIVDWCTRQVARRSLRRDECPRCQGQLRPAGDPAAAGTCDACGVVYLLAGDEEDLPPVRVESSPT